MGHLLCRVTIFSTIYGLLVVDVLVLLLFIEGSDCLNSVAKSFSIFLLFLPPDVAVPSAYSQEVK